MKNDMPKFQGSRLIDVVRIEKTYTNIHTHTYIKTYCRTYEINKYKFFGMITAKYVRT